MGKIRKLTGAQGQIDVANRNADAQIAAAKSAAAAQVAALNASAKAAADAQAQAADRSRVEATAAASAGAPLGVADVALDPMVGGSAATGRRKLRAQFGGSSSGVSI